ncbi:MAG TPA: bi-domain-containing oxidoreductase [Melioribacteraceae bacterium]|nr:bi-domain-containing oxidoreductase [Melioribacteraceae bacterium]
MLQLTQNFKNGKMELLEVPIPAIQTGYVLVRNHYSVISAGTEGKTVTDARKGYIAKAKSRQKEVKQVIEMAKSQGLLQTYKTVMNKLDSPSALGYSCAGEVIAMGEGITKFKVGDYVACGGANAVHAEVVSVPKNLCVKVPKDVDLKYASFTTVASIALQGVRQADLRIGENCVVIGLGLIGQLTVQYLNAAGVKTFGIDIEQTQVEMAKKSIIDFAITRDDYGLEKAVTEFTKGNGVDAVIITAGTSSLDPIELAGEICRKKGKVVIVGAVPTGFSRANYYKKELELRMSSSYGPGRYDVNYEEKGIDYPIGYVRWTENRNMEAFVDLLQRGKLNLEQLITHVYDFRKSPEAYDLILSKKEPFTGILLKYDVEKELKKESITFNKEIIRIKGKPNVGFIGAGTFSQNYLLPNLIGYVNFVGVSTSSGNSSRNIANKYNFDFAASDSEEILNNDHIDTVFIATRHNLHYKYVLDALKNGKNIFTEKPLCMSEAELEEINKEYQKNNSHLMVGYNRRFSPMISKIKKFINPNLPTAINYRINAGIISKEHWIQDPDVGGGRIIGEICHFIDLAIFLTASKVSSVSAESLDDAYGLMDSVTINLKFENGSIAGINYFSNGNKALSKEYLEVFNGGSVWKIDDFRELEIYGNKKEKIKSRKQDKGHAQELKEFISSLFNDNPLIPFEELYHSTLVTFKIIESIKNRKTIIIRN